MTVFVYVVFLLIVVTKAYILPRKGLEPLLPKEPEPKPDVSAIPPPWSGVKGLEPMIPVPKTGALPLGYTPFGSEGIEPSLLPL